MGTRPLRLLTTLLATFTSVIAFVVLIIVSLLDREGGATWVFTKLATGAFILTVGMMTIRQISSSPPENPLSHRLTLAAAAILVPLGALTVVGTAHLATQTGDTEWYMVVAGLAMICQGFLTVLTLSKPAATGA